MIDKAEAAIREAAAAFQAGDLTKARELAERDLKSRPDSPELQHLIGLIDCRAGRLDDGIEWLRRASDAQPANIGFRVMLVRALVDARRADQALTAAGVPGTSPAEHALWYARAEAADAARNPMASADAWRAIANFRPHDWRAWTSLGNALASLEDWPAAAEAFRRAVEINPSELALRLSLAEALRRAGRNEEALAQFDVLVPRLPANAELRLARAQTLDALGRSAEALREFDESARLFTASVPTGDDRGFVTLAAKQGQVDVEALRSLATLFERTSRMDSLAQLVEQAERQGIVLGSAAAVVALHRGDGTAAKEVLLQEKPEPDPERWHRLMSRIGEALGDPALAFSEAEAMNRSVADFDGWRKKAAAYRRHIRDLADTFTGEWLASIPVLEPDTRRSPVFLVGFPRSGTTLLDTFLMGHLEVQVLEEVPMLAAAQKALGAMTDLPRCSRTQLREARRAYWQELDRHLHPGFAGLVIDKLPMNMLGLPLIHSLFPGALVIFAQRHPADAVLSGFMQSFVLNDTMASFLDIDDAADLYDAAMSAFTRARDHVGLRVHTSVYERLVEDPEGSLRALVDLLGLEWQDELLDHQRTARQRGAIVTPSYDQVVRPLSRAPSGRWRRYRKQVEPVLSVLLPWAQRLGYPD